MGETRRSGGAYRRLRLGIAAALLAAGAGLTGPAAATGPATEPPEDNYELYMPAQYMTPTPSKIVFHSDRDGNFEIYKMNQDGTSVVRLTNHAAIDQAPSWGAGQTKIVFQSNRITPTSPEGDNEIYTMEADGTNVQQLTNNNFDEISPSWSPALGGKIAFASNRAAGPDYDIYAMNIDGSGVITITNNSVADAKPRWSPDGTKLAYVSGSNIVIANADGSNAQTLTAGSDPDWSPNGAQIVYRCNLSGDAELCLINATGGPVLRLTDTTGLPQPLNTIEFNPVFAPGGQVLAFLSNLHESTHDVYTMTLPVTTTTRASFFRVTGAPPPAPAYTEGGLDW